LPSLVVTYSPLASSAISMISRKSLSAYSSRARVSVAIVDRVRCEAGNLVAMGCSLAGLAQASLLIRMQRMHPPISQQT